MSGQVFRWDDLGDGRLLGVDGENWFLVDQKGTSYEVQSNGDESDFKRLFRLELNLNEITKKVVDISPELKLYVDQLPGLRVMRPSDVVEETFCFLCTANNNLKRILKMVRVLAAQGEILAEVEDRQVHRFPTVEQIANLDEQFLRQSGFGYRARTIPEIARQVVERGGKEWLESLKEQQYETAHEKLTELKGVGPKLADCICLFALDHTEAVPVDTHLWQAAIRLYFPEWEGKSLTGKRYKEIGDHFRSLHGEHAGWAHQYLFYDNLLNWRTYRKG